MTSRTAQYASRLIEAGWLAAVIATPVFFNVWSNRVFEPDKLTLLRSIALLMVAAAAVRILEDGLPNLEAVRRWARTPLVAPVLAMTAMVAFSSMTSWVRRLSVGGSYTRLQGLYSWLAYVVVFVAIVTLLRRRAQLDRLVDCLIVPSLPVALYGIVQKFNLDPMPWLGDVTVRVASTMGNSIFVAAYLIMVVPLTLERLTAALRALDRDERNAAVLRVSGYLVLLAVQVMAIVFAQSRGPLLGFLGGLFFLLLLMAAMRGRRAMLGVLGLGAALAAFLVVFNLQGSPLAPLRDVPYLGRMGRVFETERGTGKVRVLIWGGALELFRDDPVRTVIGYGPESMHIAYNRFYPPELAHYEARNASPDRSHNETLDVLVQMGLLGFAAYLYLYTSLFYFALKWLGLIESAPQRRLFLALWFGGGLLSTVGFYLWAGSATFFGVALPAGMIAGLFSYVAWQALAGWQPSERPGGLILAGLVAALIAHFIEIHFGIAIAATRTLFFALMGTLVVVGALSDQHPELLAESTLPDSVPSGPRRRKRRRRSDAKPAPPSARAWSARAFLMLVLLVTLSYDLLVDVRFGSDKLQYWAILAWLIGLTWGIGSLIMGTELLVLPGGSALGLGRYLAITVGGLAVYAFAHGLVLYSGTFAAQAGRGADTSSSLLMLFYVVLFTLLLLWGWVLARGDPPVGTLVRRRYWSLGILGGALAIWQYLGLVLLAAFIAFVTNVNEVRADIYYKQAYVRFHNDAQRLQASGDWSGAATYYRLANQNYDRALDLDPDEDYYLLFKGKVLLEEADGLAEQFELALQRQLGQAPVAGDFSEYELASGDTDLDNELRRRDRAFEDALQVLDKALETAPLNTDHHANLGRAYQVWGDRTFDPEKQAERLAESRMWFESAIQLSPHNAQLLEEVATTEYLAGRTEAALERIDEALAIDPEYGRLFRLRATIRREAGDWAAAEEEYRRYVTSREGKKDTFGWSALAFVLGQQNKLEEARVANEKVLDLVKPDSDLPTLRNLVILCRDLQDIECACDYAARGLEGAPEDPGLRQLSVELGCPASGQGEGATE